MAWSPTADPIPVGGDPEAGLVDITCPTAGGCVGVGLYRSGVDGLLGVVGFGSPGAWNVEPLPVPPGGVTGARAVLVPSGVACTDSTSCVVVGVSQLVSGDQVAFIDTGGPAGWTATAAPLPPDASTSQSGGPVGQSTLNEVSCSSSACAAIGTYQTPTGQKPLLVTGSGSQWEDVVPMLPSDASTAPAPQLNGVACAGTTCTAVGSYQSTHSGEEGLIESGSKATWTPVGPLTYSGAFQAVACATASLCEAVGTGELFTGAAGSWTSGTVPTLADADGPLQFNEVACPDATTCTVAGGVPTAGTVPGVMVVATGLGSSWSTDEVTLPSSVGSDPLPVGLACSDATHCAVAGNSFVLTEGAASWSVEALAPPDAIPGPVPDGGLYLQAVGCGPGGPCTAVGAVEDTDGRLLGMATSIGPDGLSSVVVPLPPDAGVAPDFQPAAVSCPPSGGCVAVGSEQVVVSLSNPFTSPAIEVQGPSGWSQVPLTLPPGPSLRSNTQGATGLNAVSCSNTWCTAVGSYTDPSNVSVGISVSGWGNHWSTDVVPATPKLAGVSCSAAGACVSTGGGSLLVSTSPGAPWTPVTPPLPANASPTAPNPGFSGVSCDASGTCLAIGSYLAQGSGSPVELTETGSGSSWTPDELTTGGALRAVSCGSPGGCAVLATDRHSQADILFGSGTSWVEPATPVPAGGSSSAVQLGAVTCPSLGPCVVAGAYVDAAGGTQGMVVTGSGTDWSASPLPAIPQALRDGPGASLTIQAVACDETGSSCAVADHVLTGPGSATSELVVGSPGGPWSSLAAPLAGGGTTLAGGPATSLIRSLACLPSGACVAAGSEHATGSSLSTALYESDQPQVDGVSPATGPVSGGTVVTVTGAGFTSDAEVTVGGVPASSVTYRSPTSLRVVVPAVVTPRSVDVQVTTGAGPSPLSPTDTYRYLPDAGGYRMVAADGGVFAYGDAPFEGSAGSLILTQPMVGIAPTPDGGGYWLVAADGGVFAYGDAAFEGSAGSLALNRPIVGIAPTPDGGGYWLVAADGGVFAYGDAVFEGSAGSLALNRPIVGIAPTPDGRGYWLVAADGGVFAYGDAAFEGSVGSGTLAEPVVGVAG